VRARTELDLRLGAAFTRLQTLTLQNEFEGLDGIMSYGPCQFPTMWFVVQRAKRIEAFVQARLPFTPAAPVVCPRPRARLLCPSGEFLADRAGASEARRDLFRGGDDGTLYLGPSAAV
jgi:hypothetical protein